MMNTTPTPRTIRARHTMLRIRQTDQADQDRRQRAAKNGYRGPLTRAEYAARAARNTSSR
jgi:hypothetical protein